MNSRLAILAGLLLIGPLCAATESPVLYLFAHQDDEILALPKLIHDVKEGRPVHAVWITDGSRSANPVRREQESRAVMKLVGVPESHLHFLGFPDQKSHLYLPAIHEKLSLIVPQQAFAEIVSPAYEGGNIDHDVAAFLAAQMAGPRHLEYPLYNRYRGHRRVGVFLPGWQSEEHFAPMDAGTRALISAAIKQYRSERLSLWLLQFVADKKGLLDRGVPFRVAPAYDFLRRPIDEPCDYERSLFHRARFSEWQTNVAGFLSARSPASSGSSGSRGGVLAGAEGLLHCRPCWIRSSCSTPTGTGFFRWRSTGREPSGGSRRTRARSFRWTGGFTFRTDCGGC